MTGETKTKRVRRIAYALRESFGHVAPEPTLSIPFDAWRAIVWGCYDARIDDEEIAMRAIDAVFAWKNARGAA